MGFFNSKSKSSSSTVTKQFSNEDLEKLRNLVGEYTDRALNNVDMSASLDPLIAGYEKLGGELDVDAIMGYYEPRARESSGQNQQLVNRAVGSGLGTGKQGNALASLVTNQMQVDTETGLASKRAELESADQQIKQNWFTLLDNIKKGDENAMLNLWSILKGSDARSDTSTTQTYKPSGMDSIQSSMNFIQTGDSNTSLASMGKNSSALGTLLGMGK